MFESLASCSAFRCSAPLNMTFPAGQGAGRAGKRSPGGGTLAYFELVLRVVVETRSSETSFGLPIASTSLPV